MDQKTIDLIRLNGGNPFDSDDNITRYIENLVNQLGIDTARASLVDLQASEVKSLAKKYVDTLVPEVQNPNAFNPFDTGSSTAAGDALLQEILGVGDSAPRPRLDTTQLGRPDPSLDGALPGPAANLGIGDEPDPEAEAIAEIIASTQDGFGPTLAYAGTFNGNFVFRDRDSQRRVVYSSDGGFLGEFDDLSGTGGGSGRTQFESERLRDLANAGLLNAQTEALLAGSDPNRFQRLQGGLFDPSTGNLIDPSELGLGRDTLGENARQFDASFGEDQRQFDANFGLNAGRLGLDTARDIGRLNLDTNDQIRQILTNPADFLFRAFTTRGEESPFPQVTQGDLITRLRDEIGKALDLGSDVASATPPVAPPVAPRITKEFQVGALTGEQFSDPSRLNAVPAGAPAGRLASRDTGAQEVAQAATEAGLSREEAALAAQQSLNQTIANSAAPGAGDPNSFLNRMLAKELAAKRSSAGRGDFETFEHGGSTQARRLIVGDSPDNKENEEVIENPTGAPLRIRSKRFSENGTPRFQFGTTTESFEPTSTPLARFRTRTTTSTPPGGGPGSLASRLPDLSNITDIIDRSPVTQDQIRANNIIGRPPAVRDVQQGRLPADFRTPFNQLTPRQLSSLSPGEIQALNTSLLAEHDIPLEDVLFDIQRRFGGSRARGRGRLAI